MFQKVSNGISGAAVSVMSPPLQIQWVYRSEWALFVWGQSEEGGKGGYQRDRHPAVC
jgi:hypothetical protein